MNFIRQIEVGTNSMLGQTSIRNASYQSGGSHPLQELYTNDLLATLPDLVGNICSSSQLHPK